MFGLVDTARRAAVSGLAGVLLHVHPRDPDTRLRPVGELHVEMTTHARGQVVLAGTIVLRHVRIEVVLPVEHRAWSDPAPEREPDLHDACERLAVGDRQRAWVP